MNEFSKLCLNGKQYNVKDEFSRIYVNVLECGATGDGVTDDTISILNAINKAKTNNLGVYFPKGTYLCSSIINLTVDNLIITGDKGSVIDCRSCNEYFLNFINSNNIKIENIEFICKNASAINFSDSSHVLVENCKITLEHTEGLNASAITVQRETGSEIVECNDFKILNCEIISAFLGILFQGRSEKYLKDVVVDKCIFTPLQTNISGNGELLKIDYYTCNVVLSNNKFNGCYLSAITCEEASDNITIENNIINGISGTSTYGIRTYKGQQELTSKNLSILNNIIKDCATGICNESYDNVYIIGNTITGSTTNSLYLAYATFRLVKDNYIEGAGILCRQSAIIDNNTIITSEGAIAIQLIGTTKTKIINNIVEKGYLAVRDSDNLMVRNNNFVDTVQTSTGAIVIFSNDSVVRNNFKIIDNIINGSNLNYGIYIANNQNNVYVKNNVIENSSYKVNIKNTVTNLINMDARYYENFGSIPTEGSYHKGDVIWNSNPVANSPIGYVCTQTGNPGTWKPFGAITE